MNKKAKIMIVHNNKIKVIKKLRKVIMKLKYLCNKATSMKVTRIVLAINIIRKVCLKKLMRNLHKLKMIYQIL